MKEESHDLQKTGIPDATGFAPGTLPGKRGTFGGGVEKISVPQRLACWH
ncbi:hypothetical protein [Rhizobium leguminosarum]|nr:hypothetical protein [Rhizobium leguminosarum]MBP2448724.1 hypothetical protein [Rhizobium leguminosarum]